MAVVDDYSGYSDTGLNWVSQETGVGTAKPMYPSSGPVDSGGDVSELLKMVLANRGRKNMADIYRENRDYNKGIMDEAYVRSLPKGVRGPAGMVSWDPDEEGLSIELDPEIQAIRDGWLRAERRAGEELAAYDMDERTIKQISMFDKANEFRDRQAKLAMDEQNFQRGIGGTQAFYNNMTLGEQVNQRRLQEAIRAKEMSMGERNLLSAENLAFGNAAIESGRAAMQTADLARLIGQGSHTGVNAEGTSLASMALADTKAGFWSGLMGQANEYGGGPAGSSGGGGGLLSGLMKGFSIFN
jgi:hypothetical protein